MATVELVDVRKNYGNVPAVRGVSLAAADGEFIVLVGPSGCGKSTLLRMVAGLETITAGTVTIDGVRVNDKEPADRDIAMVFQNYALYPHMTVRANLEYGLRNRGVQRDEIARRVGEAADLLEIAPMLDRKPRQLSGGQRQRVAMGRALVRDPKAFLFDEPLSNLDAKLRIQMRVEIRRLQRRLGTTSLYVTHDQLEAMTLADRLVVMNGGLVEQIGTPEEVYDRPATLFVAGFIGSPPMNLLPIASLRAAVDRLPDGLPSASDIIGIRPDEMFLASPGAGAVAVPVRVELVEPAGGESYVYARLPASGEAVVVRVQGKLALPDGGQLTLHVRAADFHPFSRETGRRTD